MSDSQESSVTVKVTHDPIGICDAEDLARSSDGGLVVFAGSVRHESEGRRVDALEYESYAQMAEKQMREIAESARARFELGSVLLLHRTGHLEVGEVSVVAAASAPHRDAAFAGCRFCIDEVKQHAAIWKKEIYADGNSRWVG